MKFSQQRCKDCGHMHNKQIKKKNIQNKNLKYFLSPSKL